MSQLAITRSVQNGTVFTQAQNETQCSDIETFINTTKLSGTDNIQSSTIIAANMAPSSIVAAALATDAVTTVKIQDSAVTGSKLNSGVVDNSTIQLVTNVLSVKDAGITTAKILDGNVTQAKLAARATGVSVAVGGVATSTSSGGFTTSSGSFVSVTNLTTTLVTSGRPVVITCVPAGPSADSFFGVNQNNGVGVTASAVYGLFANGTEIARFTSQISVPFSGGTAIAKYDPPGYISFVHNASASTYTYVLKAAIVTSGTICLVNNVAMVSYEL